MNKRLSALLVVTLCACTPLSGNTSGEKTLSFLKRAGCYALQGVADHQTEKNGGYVDYNDSNREDCRQY